METESIAASRTFAAPADRIFAVLSDPARHQETEPTDWVRDAIDAKPIAAVGGHIWRYDLAENGGSTDVTLTYDWSGVSDAMRENIPFPPFGKDFLEKSLAGLDEAIR